MKRNAIKTERLAAGPTPILSKREATERYMKRLYPTVKEEREYRELKEKYGL